ESLIYFKVSISLGILFWVPLAVYIAMGISALHINVCCNITVLNYCPSALAVERCFATLFSSWYEKQTASTLIVLFALLFGLELFADCNAYVLIYGWLIKAQNCIDHGILNIYDLQFFQYILTMNIEYNRRLQRMTTSDYCLSRSYQIKENIKIMKMLRKLALPTFLLNIPAFALIAIYLLLPIDGTLGVVNNVAVALFDLWIAVIYSFFGLLVYNLEPRLQESVRRWSVASSCLDKYDEITGRIRKLTIASPTPSLHNKTDIYF
ncbi:hypothetical protein PENTCL1PPCAC_16121, partial [Pristionchus entomophagus]